MMFLNTSMCLFGVVNIIINNKKENLMAKLFIAKNFFNISIQFLFAVEILSIN